MKFQATIGEHTHDVVLNLEDGSFTSGDETGEYTFEQVNGRYILRVGTKIYKIDNVQYDGSEIEFSMDGQ